VESGRDQLMLLIYGGPYLYLIGCCFVLVDPVGPVGHVGPAKRLCKILLFHSGCHAKRLFKPPLLLR